MDVNFDDVDALLLIGDSERCADLYYATRFRAPDTFVFVWTAAEKILMIGDLELDRARTQAEVDRVVAHSHYERQLKRQGGAQPGFHDFLLALLQDLGVKKLRVPADFPLGTADFLRQARLQLQVAAPPFFPQRQIKTVPEVEAIRRAVGVAEQGMGKAIAILHQAEPRDQVLYYQDQILTSERVQRLIHAELMELDCTARHTIVAGGEQACDPHLAGSGPLSAGEPIIIDIFPQAVRTGYFGDLTRTVLKGGASDPVKRLYETVRRGQELALERIRAGADGSQIHQAISRFFVENGYETGEKDGHMQGFFHGTGHGLGLEIHEAPRIGPRGDVLQAGQVVTVEPGLYYPGLGGVRIEDVVVVRDDGCENLTTFPKFLEL